MQQGHLHMLNVVHFTKEKVLNGRVKLREPFFFLCIREIHRLVSSWCDYVELRIKHVYPWNNPTQPWEGKCSMTFILSRSIFAANINFQNSDFILGYYFVLINVCVRLFEQTFQQFPGMCWLWWNQMHSLPLYPPWIDTRSGTWGPTLSTWHLSLHTWSSLKHVL